MRLNSYLLIMAKAPVAGFVKTRLCPPATPAQAAEVAAAALLDTLDAARATGLATIVALAGDVARSARAAEIERALARVTVIGQRGDGLAERLVNAHAVAAARHPGMPVVQIGADTPQVTGTLLAEAASCLTADHRDAVFGLATDGGWWALGLRDPRHAPALRQVPMSTPDTGNRTHRALMGRGLAIGELPVLSDVDTMVDAELVAQAAPSGRFAAAVNEVLLATNDHGLLPQPQPSTGDLPGV